MDNKEPFELGMPKLWRLTVVHTIYNTDIEFHNKRYYQNKDEAIQPALVDALDVDEYGEYDFFERLQLGCSAVKYYEEQGYSDCFTIEQLSEEPNFDTSRDVKYLEQFKDTFYSTKNVTKRENGRKKEKEETSSPKGKRNPYSYQSDEDTFDSSQSW